MLFRRLFAGALGQCGRTLTGMTLSFISRRSAVYAARGMVASSQPLATQAGLRILMQGGNAADAAVATAAALNVTEPCSTGIGGDMFALYFEAATRAISAINGSGRAPAALDIARIAADNLIDAHGEIADPRHAHCVTVPGAAAGWCDFLTRHGSMTMHDVLTPAIELAESGFPVAPLAAQQWASAVKQGMLRRGPEMTLHGAAPLAGQRFRTPGLARTFRALAEGGRNAFYDGPIAQAIARHTQMHGGVLTETDLAAHVSTWETPIRTRYRNAFVYECPPNGQGLAALLALNIIEGLPAEPALGVARLHAQIEALRLAFADTRWFVADPATNPAPLDALLSKSYARTRRAQIDRRSARADALRGQPVGHSDTVYFCAVDGAGNAASFINSNYMGFGTGIVPAGWGFTLQNRGHNFSLDAAHPNALAPGKRPYHTIIPALLTRTDGSLLAPFGVMGGFMQPQGHLQVVMNLLDDGLDPQQALDQPRICLEAGTADSGVALETGIAPETVDALRAMGHSVRVVDGAERGLFGRGQLILRDVDGTLIGGSDPRADGCAMGF
jgi:gamma-glutamyltranspeptidase / glutathione hydrolase